MSLEHPISLYVFFQLNNSMSPTCVIQQRVTAATRSPPPHLSQEKNCVSGRLCLCVFVCVCSLTYQQHFRMRQGNKVSLQLGSSHTTGLLRETTVTHAHIHTHTNRRAVMQLDKMCVILWAAVTADLHPLNQAALLFSSGRKANIDSFIMGCACTVKKKREGKKTC